MEEVKEIDKIFVVGKYMTEVGANIIWDIIGVFDTRKKAEAACITDRYFVGPLPGINMSMTDKREHWPGCYYPKKGEFLLI